MMNSIFLSPHFPPNFINFAIQLRKCGARVLGLADEPYEHLSEELKNTLTEYYRVNDMHNYDELVRAMGYFTHRYGKIDHIDSHNEYWLETEAKLRTDFNIQGIRLDQIDKVKHKSEMKRVFQSAGLRPARGRVCRNEDQLRGFIQEVGLPVVAKPDVGVGAAKTFKIENEADMQVYLREKLPEDYIVEEYVPGQIVTFDGLANNENELVFSSSLRYSRGVMETVNEDNDIYYYAVRNIEPAVESAGLATMRAFDVRARFFHFEFFLTDDGRAIPLEVNMRPPGGLTMQMFNYLCDWDCFHAWADMLVNGSRIKCQERKYYVMYVGRKDHFHYKLSHDQVLSKYGKLVVYHEAINSVFSRAIGNFGYILRHAELKPLLEAAEAIQKKV